MLAGEVSHFGNSQLIAGTCLSEFGMLTTPVVAWSTLRRDIGPDVLGLGMRPRAIHFDGLHTCEVQQQ